MWLILNIIIRRNISEKHVIITTLLADFPGLIFIILIETVDKDWIKLIKYENRNIIIRKFIMKYGPRPS